MSNSMSRIIKLLNTMSKVQRVGIINFGRGIFYSPVHFPYILGTVMISGTVAGYATMDTLHRRRLERLDEVYEDAWETYSSRRLENNAFNSHNIAEDQSQSSIPSMTNNIVKRLTRKVVDEVKKNNAVSTTTA